MKLRYFIYLTLLNLLFTACNSNSNKSEESKVPILRPAEMITTHQDSVEVMEMVNQFMTIFKSGDLQSASTMLYTVKNDSVHPYTKEKQQEFINALSTFKVYDYELNALSFDSEKNNKVGVKIQIVPDGDIKADKGVMSFVLNPVKINNQWHLTLMDLSAEGVRRYYEN